MWMMPLHVNQKSDYDDMMFQGCTSFVDHLCYLCLVYFMLSCLFIVALWSPAGKGLILALV